MKNETKRRFIKDMNLPIQVVQEPYFSYYMTLYDRDLGTMEKYRMLQDAVEKCGSEEAFLQEYYNVRDRVISETKEVPAYHDFLEADMSVYSFEAPKLPDAHKTDVYKPQNVGQKFVSLDMKQANYQVLRMFSKDIVFGTDTYEECISRYTELEYMRNSKYLRQVIFGNMNPKRQTTIQKYCMKQVFDLLVQEYGIPLEAFAVFTFDEIVLRHGRLDQETAERVEGKAEEKILEKLGIRVAVKPFTLKDIGGKDFYVNEMDNGTVKFKKVPSIYFPQVYKEYRSIPLEEKDFVFFHEGFLARFMEPVFDLFRPGRLVICRAASGASEFDIYARVISADKKEDTLVLDKYVEHGRLRAFASGRMVGYREFEPYYRPMTREEAGRFCKGLRQCRYKGGELMETLRIAEKAALG